MTRFDAPIVNSWYKLPDADVFRVITADLDENFIEIQFSDGAYDEFDLETWRKLGAERTTPVDDWVDFIETPFNELDFYELGAAPGAEVFDFSEYYD